MRPIGTQGPLPRFSGANTNTVSWVTGPLSPNSTFNRFGISGTDLGIAWDNGRGQTLMAFGDTYGFCGAGDQQWRHNVLLRSNDTSPANGITIGNGVPGSITSGASISGFAPNYAQNMIPSLGLNSVEITTIPTAAIALGPNQFINYMSVRTWGVGPGRWQTNFSGIAVSGDNGQTWHADPKSIRLNAGGNGKFQQNAYAQGTDGWVYQYGTPNGRYGGVFLARFQPADILDATKYQYWTGDPKKPWTNKVDEVSDRGMIVLPPIGELSVAWNSYLGRYIMLHGVGDGNTIVMNTAKNPWGPWSPPRTLVPPNAIVGIYAPFIYPNASGPNLYFTASSWGDYNVMLLHTNLARIPVS
ncbi:hypothetical protein GCM10027169_31150 [Gordonia jinhuaensis]|uniref:DUF4185 domain-containing protein n=1 Tax=Gordonia jinhuaensis TaxID=1517702 RepID=A0A916T7S0_9ACTN|nr:DUF4185 domain-containing protein [Gordonia jinhuaensis]GGB34899.1 hypothetical protein GCM10011489_23680 [Gordonia jinhuaensis]